MPYKIKFIWRIGLFIAGIFALYGIGHWGYNMDWLNSYDQWIVNTAKYPGTFGIVIGLAIGTVFIPEAIIMLRQHLLVMERKGEPSSALPQMTVHQIAEYLRNKSVWACKTYTRLNFMQFVQDAIPSEMTRAGSEGAVRFLGTHPNAAMQLEEIPRTYWVLMMIDGDRIWNNRNRAFTVRRGLPPVSLSAYEYGTAPRVDVERAWPKASFFRKAFSVCYVWCKVKWLMNIKPYFTGIL